MIKRQRPCKHMRRIKTKNGVKRVVVNPKIKKRTVTKRRNNYGAFPDISRKWDDYEEKELQEKINNYKDIAASREEDWPSSGYRTVRLNELDKVIDSKIKRKYQ